MVSSSGFIFLFIIHGTDGSKLGMSVTTTSTVNYRSDCTNNAKRGEYATKPEARRAELATPTSRFGKGLSDAHKCVPGGRRFSLPAIFF